MANLGDNGRPRVPPFPAYSGKIGSAVDPIDEFVRQTLR